MKKIICNSLPIPVSSAYDHARLLALDVSSRKTDIAGYHKHDTMHSFLHPAKNGRSFRINDKEMLACITSMKSDINVEEMLVCITSAESDIHIFSCSLCTCRCQHECVYREQQSTSSYRHLHRVCPQMGRVLVKIISCCAYFGHSSITLSCHFISSIVITKEI